MGSTPTFLLACSILERLGRLHCNGCAARMKIVATSASYELPLILSTHTNVRLFLRQR